MASLKDKFAKSQATGIACPEWYTGTGDYAWDALDDESKQWALDNKDEAIATFNDAGSNPPDLPSDAKVITDSESLEIDAWANKEAQRIDKPALELMTKAVEMKGNARRVVLTLAKDVVIRLYTIDGRGKAGNDYALPLARTADDIVLVHKPTKNNAEKKVPKSRIEAVFMASFGKAIADEIKTLEDLKERTVDQKARLDALRKERSDGKDYWHNAVELVQKMFLVNKTGHARVTFSSDERALRGPSPLIVCELVDKEVNGELVKDTETGHVQMSVESFLKFGTRTKKDTQGNVIETFPIEQGMSYAALSATRPPLKGRGTGGKGQGATDKNTEGLAIKQIENVNQLDTLSAEYATALGNKGLVTELIARLHSKDSDDLLTSCYRIYRTFYSILNNKDLKDRYDELRGKNSGIAPDLADAA